MQLDNFPQQQQQQQLRSSEPEVVQAHAPGAAAAAAGPGHQPLDKELLLCRVLCGVLNDSGVLPALLDLQKLDTLDIEGMKPIFIQQLQQEIVILQSRDLSQQQEGEEMQGVSEYQQQQKEKDENEAITLCLEPPARQQLLSCQLQQRTEQLALLRDYLTAATAKDCAIMITLQQAMPFTKPVHVQRHTQTKPPEITDNRNRSCSIASVDQSGISSNNSRSRSNQVYTDCQSGCRFAWQLSLVDLDLKPLAKIKQHAELDKRIVANALQHHELLLQQLQARDKWLNAWFVDASAP